MSLIRTQPSAVGAFEAQVFDFNKTYKAIVDNAAAQRKKQSEAAKAIEKQVDMTLGDNRLTRVQDSEYLDSLKQDVLNTFVNNKDNIVAGGKSLSVLKEKMGKFKSEVSRSAAARDNGIQMNPVVGKIVKDPNIDASETTINNWKAYQKPINEWGESTFEYKGQNLPIEQFNLMYIESDRRFDEIKDINAQIDKLQKVPYEEKVIAGKNQYGLIEDKTITHTFVRPLGIFDKVETAFRQYPKTADAYFSKEYNIYQTLPQQQKELELKQVFDAYKELDKVDEVRMAFTKDGKEGINSSLEYAAFIKLKANLPEQIKSKYDYATQGMLFQQWRNGFASKKFDWLKSQTVTLDQNIVNSIKSGKFNADEWNAYLDPMFNAGNPQIGGVRAADINFSKPDAKGNITITHTTSTPLTRPDGSMITSANANEAEKYISKAAGIDVAISGNGVYYAVQKRTDIVNKRDPALPTKIKTALDRGQNAISIGTVRESVEALRNPAKNMNKFIPGVQPSPVLGGSFQSVNFK
jgi:hypothetical protein